MKPIAFVLIASLAFAADPEFDKNGDLVRPKTYREWIFLSSGVGMSYGTGGLPFGNVFVEPSAYRKFTETGKWPDKTIFALEPVSYTHLRAHETPEHLVCRLLL